MATTLFLINVAALGVCGLACLWRLAAGPTALDRAVAVDVLTAVVIGIAVWTLIETRRGDLGIIIITLTLVSFVSSTVIGRFGWRTPDPDGLIEPVEDDAEVAR